VLSVMGLVNHLGIPKLWAIAHKNIPKTEKWWLFYHASETCTECHGPCRSPQNSKTVGNSSRNRPYMKKDKFFCHSSLECTDCHIFCKSPWNPKTMFNSSRKRP
jgi:hypothetical protein